MKENGRGEQPKSVIARAHCQILNSLRGRFQSGKHGRMATKLRGQAFDRAQGWRTNMMLHSFDIVVNDLLVQAEEIQKIGKQAMSLRDFAGQLRAGWS